MNQQIKQRIKQIKNGEVPYGYKKIKIGIVPNEWEEKFIKDICDLSSGSTPSRSDKKNFKGDILWVTSGELKQRYIVDTIEKISIEALDRNNLKLYQEGTIVIAIYGLEADGVRGTASIVKNKCTISQACMAFTNFKETNNEWYYYWYIFNGEIIGRRYAQGTKQQNLSTDIVANFRIASPSINEQQKIAEIFSTQDKVIELKEKLLKEKEKQKKYLMQILLTGRKRLKGFNGEWKKVKLGKCLVEKSDKTIQKNQYPVLTSSRRGIFLQNQYFNKSVSSEDNIGYKILRKNEFTYRTMSDDGKYTFNLLEEYEIGIVSPAYSVFNVNSDKCEIKFLYYLLNDFSFNKYIMKLIQGGTRLALRYSELCKLEIKLPPLEEQKAIAEILTTADKELKLLQEELEEEKRKKKALMQLLLTGIVRVEN